MIGERPVLFKMKTVAPQGICSALANRLKLHARCGNNRSVDNGVVMDLMPRLYKEMAQQRR